MKPKIPKLLVMAALAGLMTSPASAVMVGLELSLLVDVSGSVDNNEWQLQRNGYVSAFNSPAIHALISTLASQHGGNGLAVSYTQWASNPTLSVGWTLINNAADAIAFANLIAAAPRPSTGAVGNSTGIGNAIVFGSDLFTNSYEGDRQVIDVSGDGENNTGTSPATAKTYATGKGVDRINGLPIGDNSLTTYYQNNVQLGTNAFTLPVNSFDDFAPAIERKLAAEITNTSVGVPEGGPGLAVSGLVLLGLAGIRGRRTSRQ